MKILMNKRARRGPSHNRRLAAVSVTAVIAIVVLAACGDSSSNTTSAESSPNTTSAESSSPEIDQAITSITIAPVLTSQAPEVVQVPPVPAGTKMAFVVPYLSEGGQFAMAEGVAYAAKLLNIPVTVVDSAGDVSKQLEQANGFLAQGYSAVLGIELFPGTLDAFYEAAAAINVPTITMFSTQPASVGENPLVPGTDAAKIIQQKFPNGAEGLILSNTQAPVIIAREAAFRAVVDTSQCSGCEIKGGNFPDDPSSNIKILAEERNITEMPDTARTIAADMLQKYPDAKFIWATNDVGAMGAALAAEAAGRDILIFGMNGAPTAVADILAGKVTATWDSNQNRMGMLAVIQALNWLVSGTPPDSMLNEFTQITEQNANEYIQWADRAKWPQG